MFSLIKKTLKDLSDVGLAVRAKSQDRDLSFLDNLNKKYKYEYKYEYRFEYKYSYIYKYKDDQTNTKVRD